MEKVFKVVQVEQDAYVCVEDPKGYWIVDGKRCTISNAMPKSPGPNWRDSFLNEGIAYVRWDVEHFLDEKCKKAIQILEAKKA